jgi:hypothetical protein
LSGTFLGNRRADPFETWHKIDHHSKLCTSFLKFSKWPHFQNFKMAANNAKQFKKNTKMIIAGYSPNRNWWNLMGTTSTSGGTR